MSPQGMIGSSSFQEHEYHPPQSFGTWTEDGPRGYILLLVQQVEEPQPQQDLPKDHLPHPAYH